MAWESSLTGLSLTRSDHSFHGAGDPRDWESFLPGVLVSAASRARARARDALRP